MGYAASKDVLRVSTSVHPSGNSKPASMCAPGSADDASQLAVAEGGDCGEFGQSAVTSSSARGDQTAGIISQQNMAAASALPPQALVDTRLFESEPARECAVQSLKMLDTPPERRFDAITKLMSEIFQVPVSLVTLVSEDRVWFKSVTGPFGTCVDRDGSWCSYISVPDSPEVLITEDATKDARFAHNPYVTGPPGIRFYAGAPVLGTGGTRYGSLCIIDTVPRAFPVEMYAILNNMAELVAQEFERDIALKLPLVKGTLELANKSIRVQRAVSAATHGVALLDMRTASWPVRFANDKFVAVLGASSKTAVTHSTFWEQLELVPGDGHMDTAGILRSVATGQPVQVDVCAKGTAGSPIRIVLRPACSDQLTPGKPVGVPSWVPSASMGSVVSEIGIDTVVQPVDASAVQDLATCFWFAVVQLADADLATSTAAGQGQGQSEGRPVALSRRASVDLRRELTCFGPRHPPRELRGLTLGPLIGTGAGGRAYRGMLSGRPVAVKVVECAQGRGDLAPAVVAAVSGALRHPNIAEVYSYASSSNGLLWLATRYCNRGTLTDAVGRGWLKQERALQSPPALQAILQALHDIALGLAYLHSHSILHGNLTGHNVMFERDSSEGRLVARVTDAGLARLMAADGRTVPDRFRCVSHMPPELLRDGVLTAAADVYAFGVLALEMYRGHRLHMGMMVPSVVHSVLIRKEPFEMPTSAPESFRDLCNSCLSIDHTKRPSFDAIVSALDCLLA